MLLLLSQRPLSFAVAPMNDPISKLPVIEIRDCLLAWCAKQIPIGGGVLDGFYCSDRCYEYDLRRSVIWKRQHDFMAKLNARFQGIALAHGPIGITSEVAWSIAKCKEEEAVVERQWRSLR